MGRADWLGEFCRRTSALSCEQANRVAYPIVEDDGYIPTAFSLASLSDQGVTAGTKLRGETKGVETRRAGGDAHCSNGVHAIGDYGKGPVLAAPQPVTHSIAIKRT